MKRLLVIAVMMAAVLVAAGYAFRTELAIRAMRHLVASNLETDLLVHEALAPHLVAIITDGARKAGRSNLVTITEDILDYHTTPVEAAVIAAEADVAFLLYNYVVPPLPLAPLEEAFTRGVDDVYGGGYRVGRDGTLIVLPADNDAIEVRELL